MITEARAKRYLEDAREKIVRSIRAYGEEHMTGFNASHAEVVEALVVLTIGIDALIGEIPSEEGV